MKILYIAPNFPPDSGGISVFASNLLFQLLDQGHKIFLCVPKGSIVRPHKNLEKIIYYNSDKNVLKQFSLIFLKQIMTSSVKVVFFAQFLSTAWTGILLFSKLMRIPTVALCHKWELHYLKWKLLDRLGLEIGIKLLSLGMANSNFCKKSLIQSGMKDRNIVVLNPGANTNNVTTDITDRRVFREKYQIHDTAKIILTVCRIENIKGIDLVVEAVNNLKETYPRIVYIVVGGVAKWGKDYYENLLSVVRRYGLEKKVIFIGLISVDSFSHIYSLADIYIGPSRIEVLNSSPREESFGITYLEAAASGLPVIATKTGGISDAVENGVTGILVENENVEELTTAIKYLLDNPDIAQEMGRRGRERVEKYFTWKKVGKRLEDYLESVLK